MNKRILSIIVSVIVHSSFAGFAFSAKSVSVVSATDATSTGSGLTPQNRGLFAFLTGTTSSAQVQVSWRMRATDDPKTTTYELYATSTGSAQTPVLVATTTNKTLALLENKYKNYTFSLKVKDANGNVIDEQGGVKAVANPYLDIPLITPDTIKDEVADTTLIYYDPSDASAYDIDGDGEQEIILKWFPHPRCVFPVDPSTGKRGTCGVPEYASHEYMDCYKLDGTRLWRIDMGQNVAAGNSFTFMCWDFDGDGKGEMIVKTAPGSKDATGAYVGSAAHSDTGENLPGYDTDLTKNYWRGSEQYPTSDLDADGNQISHEWITCYSWDGKELGSKQYWPYFSQAKDATGKINWDDRSGSTDGVNYGHRGNGFKSAVINIPCKDGATRPCCYFQRGIYSFVYCTAVSWNGTKLVEEWRHDSNSSDGLYSQGAHTCCSADLDGDGYDEVAIGAAAVDHDGKTLWSTGLGHGDVLHVGEFCPQNPGLEVYRVTEASTAYDACIMSGKDGSILAGAPQLTAGDAGRGIILDIDSLHPGKEFMVNKSFVTINDTKHFYTYSAKGTKIYTSTLGTNTNMNYRIYWDDDLLDELLDGTIVANYNLASHAFERCATPGSGSKSLYSIYKVSTINDSKSNPCLQCDLFGDWREELVFMVRKSNDNSIPNSYGLRILTTKFDTEYKLPWLRDDNTYNKQIACQNIGYSMPPHLGYNPVEYFEEQGGVKPGVSYSSSWNFSDAGMTSLGTETDVTADTYKYAYSGDVGATRSEQTVSSILTAKTYSDLTKDGLSLSYGHSGKSGKTSLTFTNTVGIKLGNTTTYLVVDGLKKKDKVTVAFTGTMKDYTGDKSDVFLDADTALWWKQNILTNIEYTYTGSTGYICLRAADTSNYPTIRSISVTRSTPFPTAINEVQGSGFKVQGYDANRNRAVKIMKDGQLIIETTNGRRYNTAGQALTPNL